MGICWASGMLGRWAGPFGNRRYVRIWTSGGDTFPRFTKSATGLPLHFTDSGHFSFHPATNEGPGSIHANFHMVSPVPPLARTKGYWVMSLVASRVQPSLPVTGPQCMKSGSFLLGGFFFFFKFIFYPGWHPYGQAGWLSTSERLKNTYM